MSKHAIEGYLAELANNCRKLFWRFEAGLISKNQLQEEVKDIEEVLELIKTAMKEG